MPIADNEGYGGGGTGAGAKPCTRQASPVAVKREADARGGVFG